MKLFSIYGASDDLVETDGLLGCDEFNVYSDTPYIGYGIIKSSEATIKIHCIYDGHWCFGIGPEDGDYDEMPNWKQDRVWGEDRGYSESIKIECPDDAVFSFHENK